MFEPDKNIKLHSASNLKSWRERLFIGILLLAMTALSIMMSGLFIIVATGSDNVLPLIFIVDSLLFIGVGGYILKQNEITAELKLRNKFYK